MAVFFLVLPRITWDWASPFSGSRPQLWLAALWTTLWVSALSMVLSIAIGVLGGLARLSPRVVPNQLGTIYVEVIRNTPLLVQIFLGWFCVAPIVGSLLESLGAPVAMISLTASPHLVGIAILSVFTGAYVTEIVRAAVLSIDRGQMEAALSQGMTRMQAYRHVIFPQAFKRMIPPLTGQMVSMIKDSSLLYAITGFVELSRQASTIRSTTYRDYEVLIPLALLYFLLCFPLSRLARRLELKLAT
jgi:polar amino acid transport system permease protein